MVKRKTTKVAESGPTEEAVAKPTKSQPAKATGKVFQLKITLKDIKPPIWRRVQVPDCSLDELHGIIQVAMGWEDYHLYSFKVGGTEFSDPRGSGEIDMEDASRVKLSRVIPREKNKFRYTYDFGDSWEHEILVEKILPPEEGQKYPVCLEGKRSCPPEDVGGPWGYEEVVEAIRDPHHEQHEELLEWGGDFDPEAFDLDAVNKGLRRLK
jgi:Plasmid pRiA4b ORF-3-like protein